MELALLKKTYPQSFYTWDSLAEPDYLTFSDTKEQLVIPTIELSDTEWALLKNIQQTYFNYSVSTNRNQWYQFIFKNSEAPSFSCEIRLLQFILEDTENTSATDWLNNLSHMFNEPISHFFVTPQLAFIIEKKEKNAYFVEEIEGILKTLENDFSIRAKGFIGNFLTSSPDLRAILLEEHQLFQSEQASIRINQVSRFEDIALLYLTKETFQSSKQINYLKQQLELDEEMMAIISTLWKHQGNISSTAKELFMHRNTLRYRIDKFSEQSYLSLKSMNGLALAYLFVLHETH